MIEDLKLILMLIGLCLGCVLILAFGIALVGAVWGTFAAGVYLAFKLIVKMVLAMFMVGL